MAMELQDPSPNALPIFQPLKPSIRGIRWSLDLGAYLMFGSWCLELSSVPVEQLRDFAMPAPCRPGQRRCPWRIVGSVRLCAALQKQLDHGSEAPRSKLQAPDKFQTPNFENLRSAPRVGAWTLEFIWCLVPDACRLRRCLFLNSAISRCPRRVAQASGVAHGGSSGRFGFAPRCRSNSTMAVKLQDPNTKIQISSKLQT